MSDYFPPEMIEKVLHKLPAKSLIRFTTVCKSWRSIITSPSFVSSYLYKPINETLLLRQYDEHDNQERYSLLEVSKNRPFTITSSSQLEFPLKSQMGCFAIVGSCHGVMCLGDFANGSRLIILCNPCIKKHVVLPNPTINPVKKQPYFTVMGFGVVNRNFKVVRIIFYREPSVRPHVEAEIFTIRSGGWRRLGIDDVRFQNVDLSFSQVFLNGAMHWLAYDLSSSNVSVLVFLVDQEVFDEIPLPNACATRDSHNLCLRLLGESLAVIKFGDWFCQVWLMKEYGVEGSWTKLYSDEVLEGVTDFVALRHNGEALLSTAEFELVALDLENLEVKKLGIQGTYESQFNVEDHVESLELLACET